MLLKFFIMPLKQIEMYYINDIINCGIIGQQPDKFRMKL